MQVFMGWRWIGLAIAFGLAALDARAEWITPNSIPNPPPAVNSANGTPVYANNLVTGQYAGLGVNFNGVAIANLNSPPAWVPPGGIAVGNPPLTGVIDYASGMGGNFVSPGSLNPTTVSSLIVEIIGTGTSPLPALSISVYGSNGQMLPIAPLVGFIGNQQEWTFSGAGISSFMVSPPAIDPLPNNSTSPWGVSEISFTPAQATTPEPSCLALAMLGTLGLSIRFGWRRLQRDARSAPAALAALHL